MHKLARLANSLAFLCISALAGCVAGGTVFPATVPSGVDWTYADGVLYHRPHYALPLEPQSGNGPLFPYVPYLGGSVIVEPKFYLVFWDYKKYGDADKLQPLLEAYTKNMGGSSHNNIETQYYEKSGHRRTYITNPADQFGGSWNDESPVPRKPTDAQIAAEALRAVGHFGFDPNGVYVVATPHKHSEVDFGTHWCSYHSDASYDKNLIPYAYLPYMTDAGHSGNKCGANSIAPPADERAKDEGMTIFAGHEYGESITDPFPFTAWTGPQGEIADPCLTAPMANDQFGKKSYTMQPMVSDTTESCVQSYPPSL